VGGRRRGEGLGGVGCCRGRGGMGCKGGGVGMAE